MTEFFYVITTEDLQTLRQMARGYERGVHLRYSRNRANALLRAVSALESARALWDDYQKLNDLIGQERRERAQAKGGE